MFEGHGLVHAASLVATLRCVVGLMFFETSISVLSAGITYHANWVARRCYYADEKPYDII